MLNIEKMIQSARECLGWPYKSPGSNDENGIDCSGLFVKMYKDQHLKIYHGSNTIYREYCEPDNRGLINSVSQLVPGMAVFKWNKNTPEKIKDNLGDFQHIGFVVSVSPLEIIHASSVAGYVTIDTKIGKWKYYGCLRDVYYGDISEPEPEPVTQQPAISVTYPTLRRGSPNKELVMQLQSLLSESGSSLVVDGIFGIGTLSAVRAFQNKYGLTVDGIVGPQTWTKLLEAAGNIKVTQPEKEELYTLCIPDLTMKQIEELKQKYPDAVIAVG